MVSSVMVKSPLFPNLIFLSTKIPIVRIIIAALIRKVIEYPTFSTKFKPIVGAIALQMALPRDNNPIPAPIFSTGSEFEAFVSIKVDENASPTPVNNLERISTIIEFDKLIITKDTKNRMMDPIKTYFLLNKSMTGPATNRKINAVNAKRLEIRPTIVREAPKESAYLVLNTFIMDKLK